MALGIERINWINSALVVATFALAWALPFQLLFFSYAFLGPAHYLTQISWLHDKKYFSQNKKIFWLFLYLTVFSFLISNRNINAFVLCVALIIAGYSVIKIENIRQSLVLICIVLLGLLVSLLPPMALFIVLLVPTIVHVFLFTGSFLIIGALKGESKSAFVTLALFFILGISFFFMPHEWFFAHPHLPGFPVHYFDDTALYISRITGGAPHLDHIANIFAFLSFAYTYHYLNWFSKSEIINWHKIPRRRLLAIVVIYLIAIGFYLYDYEIGFKILLFLSMLHVLLEFPLNIQVFKGIYMEMQKVVNRY